MVDDLGSLTGVAKTALGVAVVRARESLREDRLFSDPYAQRFLDAAPAAFSEQGMPSRASANLGSVGNLGSAVAFHAALRTRFFDDYLLAAAGADCRQVVLLAAGLDTRSFRLAWSAPVTVFELDLPELFAFKEKSLTGAVPAPECERQIVPVDLREDWPESLLAAGFDPAIPTAWLAEGLLLYLTLDEAVRLMRSVTDLSAPASQLAFEQGGISDPATLAKAASMPAMYEYTSLWKGGLGGDAPGWLRQHAWQPHIHDRADVASTYGRCVPNEAAGTFLTATRTGGAA